MNVPNPVWTLPLFTILLFEKGSATWTHRQAHPQFAFNTCSPASSACPPCCPGQLDFVGAFSNDFLLLLFYPGLPLQLLFS